MDKKPLYLFFGSDLYSIQQKVKHWQEEFLKKYGDLDYHLFEGEELNAAIFHEAVQTVPFLSEKKLILVKNFINEGSTEEQKKVAERLDEIPDYAIIVFVENQKPDARLALFKKIGKIGHATEMTEPDKDKLIPWIQQEFSERGITVQYGVAEELSESVGPHMLQLSQEIEKLSLYAQEKQLTPQALEALVSPNISSSIFKLMDDIGQKKAKSCLKTFNTLMESGEDIVQIFFMIVRNFRILIQVRSCLEQKLDKSQIVAKLKEHPFTITKAMTQAQQFNSVQLVGIYRKLLDRDIAIKSGKIKMTTGDVSELRLSLEKLMVELCR